MFNKTFDFKPCICCFNCSLVIVKFTSFTILSLQYGRLVKEDLELSTATKSFLKPRPPRHLPIIQRPDASQFDCFHEKKYETSDAQNTQYSGY